MGSKKLGSKIKFRKINRAWVEESDYQKKSRSTTSNLGSLIKLFKSWSKIPNEKNRA